MQIDGLGAVVTGGASGLGAATAEMLAHNGAKVTIFDMNADLGLAKATEIGGHFVAVNVADEASVNTGLSEAEAKHGKSRILVSCAGIGIPEKVLNKDGSPASLSDFSRVVNVNLIGSFNVLSKFASRIYDAEPLNADNERGVIINTASVAAFEGQIGQASYSASKGGIVGLTLPVARELARYGIRVMVIAPGIFWTPILGGLSQEIMDSLGKQVPFPPRLGRPEEYALLVEQIIRNPMLNGETIRLDGAIRMAPR